MRLHELKERRQNLFQDSMEMCRSLKEVSFLVFLRVLSSIRKAACEDISLLICKYFEDTEIITSLDRQSLEDVLVDMDIKVTSVNEQIAIDKILEQFKADGEGQISFSNMVIMMHQIREKFLYLDYEEAYRMADRMNLTRGFVNQMRFQFETKDSEKSGRLDFAQVESVVRGMEWTIQAHKLQKLFTRANDDASGTIDFREFLSLMHRATEAEGPEARGRGGEGEAGATAEAQRE